MATMQRMMSHNRLFSMGMAVLVALLCLVDGSALAQEPIRQNAIGVAVPINDDDTIVGGSDDLMFSSHIPMAGNPTMNRLMGVQTYDEPWSRFFFEIDWLFGGESIGSGFTFAYVPKHLGGYCTIMADEYDPWLTLGAVWRPVCKPSGLDWQIYGGGVRSWGWGYEVGMRFSANAKNNFDSAWSWMSGTLGVITVNGVSYTTIGVSIGIISLLPFMLL